MDIQLIQIDPNTGRVTVRMGSKAVSGITKLVQVVVLSLLNTPGQDILDPESGGGLPELVGMNFDASDLTEVMSEVTRRVRKTESEVQASQVGLNLDADERLNEIQIVSIQPGEQIDEILVRLRIVNELGQKTDVVL